MNLPIRGFTDIVRDMSSALTASAGRLMDVSVGSVLRALIDANAAVMLWAQWLVLLALQTTRAATSVGPDLDSWMADFSLSRLPAKPATGSVTFSRLSSTYAAFIPPGTIVKTNDGSMIFSVVADESNATWQHASGGYSLATGVQSLSLPVAAFVAGQAGNVLPNTITVLASSVPGVDFITNESGTNGGEDSESDGALRARFANFFAARSRATIDAIEYAISLVGSDLNYVVQENIDPSGNQRPGTILIVVDDGTGILSDGLFDSLSGALASIRPIGTVFSIQPPQIIAVQVSLHVECTSTSSLVSIQSSLRSAITEYVNLRPIGALLSITRISQLVYETDSNVQNVSNVNLNNESLDLVAPIVSAFKIQSVNFT